MCFYFLFTLIRLYIIFNFQISTFNYLYIGPKLAQALKSCPSLSMPKAFHTDGRKIFSSGTLCIDTGMRNIEHNVMRSAPMWP